MYSIEVHNFKNQKDERTKNVIYSIFHFLKDSRKDKNYFSGILRVIFYDFFFINLPSFHFWVVYEGIPKIIK